MQANLEVTEKLCYPGVQCPVWNQLAAFPCADRDLFPSQICHHKCHELTASLQRASQVEEKTRWSLLLLSDVPLAWMTCTEDAKLGSLLETHKWRSSSQGPRQLEQLSGQVCPDFLCQSIWQVSFASHFPGHLFLWELRSFLWFTQRSLCSQGKHHYFTKVSWILMYDFMRSYL